MRKLQTIPIIPCLNLSQRKLIKPININRITSSNDPITVARFFEKEGAHAIALIDLGAELGNDSLDFELIEIICEQLKIPVWLGGGIENFDIAQSLINSGISKLILSQAAIHSPLLTKQCLKIFGPDRILIGVDIADFPTCSSGFEIISGNRDELEHKDALEFAIEMEAMGVKTLIPTHQDFHGKGKGFNIELLKIFIGKTKLNILATGGAETLEHLKAAYIEGEVQGFLISNLIQSGLHSIRDIKDYLFLQAD